MGNVTKYLLVLTSLIAMVYGEVPPEVIAKFKEHHVNAAVFEECLAESGATPDDIVPMRSRQPPTTDAGKCFVFCLGKKLSLQDSSGKLTREANRAMVETLATFNVELYETLKIVTDFCFNTVTEQANACETASTMYACLKAKEMELGLII